MTFKQRLIRAVCVAATVAALPVMGAQAAPTESCVALADIDKTWFVDGMSILLKVSERGGGGYKVLEFKEYLPARLQGKDFRFVRHDAAETEELTHACVNDRVTGLETADSAPIAKIVDVDVRQAARLVKRPERLAARRNDDSLNWSNLDRAQSNAYYLSGINANPPPPPPPPQP